MKRTKRMLALVLAMMMAFAMLAIPAAAHGDEDEGIMPLYEVGICPYCNESKTVVNRDHYTHTYATTCKNSGTTHKHTTYHNYIEFECGHLIGGNYDVCSIKDAQ